MGNGKWRVGNGEVNMGSEHEQKDGGNEKWG